MNDNKHNPNKPYSRKSESDNRPRPARKSIKNDSLEYGEYRGIIVTNSFSPPVRPEQGDNSEDKSGS
ncbi:hypothetical protein GP935_21990 [Escherichia coli]|uniref:hypothetical protein n=1 Tax=Escherichia coli TaxID=562 RepID=UPI00132C06D9|nr:hypothetical protein [Escherichia coli]EKR7615299.1 hypothetical protein [Escherichia coli]MWS93179.1 hypothetical protein [Escherichia coli]